MSVFISSAGGLKDKHLNLTRSMKAVIVQNMAKRVKCIPLVPEWLALHQQACLLQQEWLLGIQLQTWCPLQHILWPTGTGLVPAQFKLWCKTFCWSSQIRQPACINTAVFRAWSFLAKTLSVYLGGLAPYVNHCIDTEAQLTVLQIDDLISYWGLEIYNSARHGKSLCIEDHW